MKGVVQNMWKEDMNTPLIMTDVGPAFAGI
jgi:hypothetical protein